MNPLRKTLLALAVILTALATGSAATAQPGGPGDGVTGDPDTTGEFVERSVDPFPPATAWQILNPETYTAYSVTDAGVPGGTADGWLLADTPIDNHNGCSVYVVDQNGDYDPHGFPNGFYNVFGDSYDPPRAIIHYMHFTDGQRIQIRVHAGDYYVIGIHANDPGCKFQFHQRPAGFYEPKWDNGDPFNPGPTIANTGIDILPPPEDHFTD